MKAQSSMTKIINHHQALIYIMVTMSGVDGLIGEKELKRIGRIVENLPVFKTFDRDTLTRIAQECGEILQQEQGGLEAVLGLVRDSLPPLLHDTGYALACEVAASDLMVRREEMRFLSMLRDALELDKLMTAALERGVIARYRSYPPVQR
jgi:tellurite resistance protein